MITRLLLSIGCLLQVGLVYAQTPAWEQAQEHIRRGEYDKSIPILQKIADTDTNHTEAVLQLGMAQQRLGRLLSAQKTYETILKKDTAQVEALNQLALIAEKNAQFRQALKYYGRLIRMDSSNAYYFKRAAVQCTNLELPEKAIWYHKKGLDRNSEDIETMAELARLYVDLGGPDNLKQATLCIEKGFKLDSNSIRLHLQNSRVDYRLGRFAEAAQSIQKTMAQGDSSAFYQRMIGRAYYEIDSLDQSVATFSRLLKLGEETEYVYAGLGTAYMLKARKDSTQQSYFHYAYANFNTAIAIAKTRIPDYEMNLADLYEIQSGPFSVRSAIKKYQDVYNSYKRPRALFRLGQLHEIHKLDIELAKVYYQETIDLCTKISKNPKGVSPLAVLECTCIGEARMRLQNLKSPASPSPAIIVKDSVTLLPDTTRKE